jgi:hypothetical protein
VEQRPDAKPKVNDSGIEELVTDKGYLSGAVVERVKSYQVRSYILEKQPKGRRKWQGKPGGTAGGVPEAAAVQGECRYCKLAYSALAAL